MRASRLIQLWLLWWLPFAGAAEEVKSSAPAPRDEIEELLILGIRPGELARIPTAATDVIEPEDRRAENATLADLLTGVEGLWLRRLGGSNDDFEVSIRGSAANQVLITLDGVPVNSILSGVGDLAGVCLPQVDRVEITRGAGGAQYGSGAVAGVIGLRTKTGGEIGTRVTASAGAFETYSGSIQTGHQWGQLGIQAGYCGTRTEGDFEFQRPRQAGNNVFTPDEATRNNNDSERHGAHLALQHPWLGGTVRLSDRFEYEDGGEPGLDGGNGVDAGQTLQARTRDWSQLAVLSWEGSTPGFGNSLTLRAHHRIESLRFRDPMPALDPPIRVRERANIAGGSLRDAWTFNAAHGSANIAIFGDGTYEHLRGRDRASESRGRGGGGFEAVVRTFQERILLSAAVRLEGADGFSPEWLPSIGVAVSPTPWLRLRTNFGRAYRVPNFNELFLPDQGFIRGNPNLDPEDAWNFDVGAEIELAEVGWLRDIRLRGGWFRRDIEDSILWVQVSNFRIQPINTGSATADGFEFSASMALPDWARVQASHTRLDSRRDAFGTRLPGQPEEETFARIEFGPAELMKLVGEVQHTGTILVDEGGGRRLPRRTLWNASAAFNLAQWRLFEQWTQAEEFWLFFEINNISDEAVRDSLAFPRPGRTASAGFEAQW